MHVLDSAWEALKRDFDSALSRKMRDLNHVFRRLRSYEDQEQWLRALYDGIAIGARKFAILTLEANTLRLRASHEIPLADGLEFPLGSARAFTALAEGREPLTTMCTAAEVGPLAPAEDASTGREPAPPSKGGTSADLGTSVQPVGGVVRDPNRSGEPVVLRSPLTAPNGRAQLFPILNSDRLVAAIFVETNGLVDADLVELVTGMASAVLERQANQKKQLQIASLAAPSRQPGETTGARQPASLPSWAALGEPARALHGKAQRFARTAVAGMELARPEACRAGREQNNLYLFLQGEIDKARDTYSKQFMKTPSMVDYLHLELTRAAGGEERQLGADYPGHLV